METDLVNYANCQVVTVEYLLSFFKKKKQNKSNVSWLICIFSIHFETLSYVFRFFSSKFEMELVFPAKDPPVQTLPQLLASLATTLAIDPLTAFLKNMG